MQTSQVFFRIVYSNCSICRCGYNLPQGFGADITHSEDSGNIGPAGLSGDCVTMGIQVYLSLQ